MSKTKISFKLLLGIWNLEITDDAKKLLVNNKKCGGSIVYKERTIYIDSSLTNDFQRVLMHELTHAILYETQLQLSDSYSEEDMCEFVGKYGKLICDIYDEIVQDLDK